MRMKKVEYYWCRECVTVLVSLFCFQLSASGDLSKNEEIKLRKTN
jgi:hypothetical protein